MKNEVIKQGFAALSLIVLTALTGCGGKLPGLVSAEGDLIYNGQPLAWATVTLIRADDPKGRPASGLTDAEGHFRLLTLGEKGAFPGSYSVRVTKNIFNEGPETVRDWLARHANGEKEDPPEERVADVVSVIPPEFQNVKTSDLTVEIGEKGNKTIRIEFDAPDFNPRVPKPTVMVSSPTENNMPVK